MKKVLAAALVLILLGGCQSIFGHKSARLDVRPVGEAQTSAAAVIALEEGRQHLIRGEVASAIVALRTASSDPATAAPAHNGLAVAYAMLGRGDLAERYFQQAIAEDPADPRFAANLARFYHSREAAMAKADAVPVPVVTALAEEVAPVTAVAEAPTERVVRAGPSLVRVSLPTPQAALTRVSRQEVVIHSAPETSVLASTDPRRRNPRFNAAKPLAIAEAYPVRIDLAKVARR